MYKIERMGKTEMEKKLILKNSFFLPLEETYLHVFENILY